MQLPLSLPVLVLQSLPAWGTMQPWLMLALPEMLITWMAWEEHGTFWGLDQGPVLPPALSPYLRSVGMGRRPPPGACGAGAGGIHHPKGMSRGMCTSSHIYYKWWLSGVPFLFF